MKKLTPLQAVRKKCLWCCCGQSGEVSLCTCDECSLYPYRNTNIKIDKPRFTLKVIKQKCIECCAGSTKEIKYCNTDIGKSEWGLMMDDCALHPWRTGHRQKAVLK